MTRKGVIKVGSWKCFQTVLSCGILVERGLCTCGCWGWDFLYPVLFYFIFPEQKRSNHKKWGLLACNWFIQEKRKNRVVADSSLDEDELIGKKNSNPSLGRGTGKSVGESTEGIRWRRRTWNRTSCSSRYKLPHRHLLRPFYCDFEEKILINKIELEWIWWGVFLEGRMD